MNFQGYQQEPALIEILNNCYLDGILNSATIGFLIYSIGSELFCSIGTDISSRCAASLRSNIVWQYYGQGF